ncbi:MAG TPA: divergent polysaccharide deacetylase family protein [Syntrophobacteria bacterium]|nr:divergent polysaccharide deacetylase family protein [Syntrophobacteria bacterium]
MARRTGRIAKGRKKGRRKRKGSFWLAAGLILLVALAALTVWMVTSPPFRHPAPPAYEENQGGEFTTLVREVDLAIYESLRQLGVPQADVQFRKVAHRSREERHGDYAHIEVQLREGRGLARAEEVLSSNLKAVSGNVRWEVNRKSASRLEARITVQGMLTHRLDFSREEVERPAQQQTKPGPPRPKVAIVIDDLGYDGRLARGFLHLQEPLSFAVLPHAAFSKSMARELHEAGREVLLHLPMEPKGYPGLNAGEGTLLVAMNDSTLVETLRQNLNAFPFIVGVNNHMGSRFSEAEDKMRVVLGEIKQRGLFFLDSRTSAESRGYSLAIQMGIPAAERDVFLDNIQSPQAIRSELRRLVQLARLKGRAVGIAHPHEVTLEVFGQVLPQLGQEGIDLVPVSQVLQR